MAGVKSRNDGGLYSPASYSGRKGTNLSPSVQKTLLVWRPGNRTTIFSGGPKLSSRSSLSSIFRETHDPLKSAHTQVSTFVCALMQRPDQRLHAMVLSCTYILIRYHDCYHRTGKAETTCEKNLFLVNFGHPGFIFFSNRCSLGSCAAVVTLEQSLANNCYEVSEKSIVFYLGQRTTSPHVCKRYLWLPQSKREITHSKKKKRTGGLNMIPKVTELL